MLEGGAKLRRTERGGRKITHGPWQTTGSHHLSFYDSGEWDTDPKSFDSNLLSVSITRKRYSGGIIVAGEVRSRENSMANADGDPVVGLGCPNAGDHQVSRYGVSQKLGWSRAAIGNAVDRSG